jgi:hypothetical protein
VNWKCCCLLLCRLLPYVCWRVIERPFTLRKCFVPYFVDTVVSSTQHAIIKGTPNDKTCAVYVLSPYRVRRGKKHSLPWHGLPYFVVRKSVGHEFGCFRQIVLTALHRWLQQGFSSWPVAILSLKPVPPLRLTNFTPSALRLISDRGASGFGVQAFFTNVLSVYFYSSCRCVDFCYPQFFPNIFIIHCIYDPSFCIPRLLWGNAPLPPVLKRVTFSVI